MTIDPRFFVSCDGRGCNAEIITHSPNPTAIENAGWHITRQEETGRPMTTICPKCWDDLA